MQVDYQTTMGTARMFPFLKHAHGIWEFTREHTSNCLGVAFVAWPAGQSAVELEPVELEGKCFWPECGSDANGNGKKVDSASVRMVSWRQEACGA